MSISARRLIRKVPVGASPATMMAGSAPVGTTAYPVPTGAIFVATTGSDSNPGTITQPVLTVKKARQITPAGGTIVLRGGVYNEGFTGTASADVWGGASYAANVTIQSYPNEAVWFDGSIPLTGWTQSGATWQAPFTMMFDRSPTFSFGADGLQIQYWSFVNPQYPTMPCRRWCFMTAYS